jgi:hypothetical protein
MNHRILVPSVLFVLLIFSVSTAPQSPGSNGRLAAILHQSTLTADDWQSLFSEADGGSAEAQYWLGRIYAQGSLLPRDLEKSVHWYNISAEQGYAPAQYAVCLMRVNGDALERERCMWRAAEDGVPEAQFWIGVAYAQRLWFGIDDKQEAFKWFSRAAESGYVDAEDELGRCYENGDGVKQNYVLASEWYRKAAEHVPNLGGAGQGRNNLGNLYQEGLGVPKDTVQAYIWFSLAGNERLVERVKADLDATQILQAQQRADEWKKLHPDPAIY